jgi:predicted DNA-binding transcriptional regulator AlpA
MKDHKGDRLLTRAEVEERFGVSKRYLEVAALRGNGPRIVRLGRMVRYRAKDIQDWIEDSTTARKP